MFIFKEFQIAASVINAQLPVKGMSAVVCSHAGVLGNMLQCINIASPLPECTACTLGDFRGVKHIPLFKNKGSIAYMGREGLQQVHPALGGGKQRVQDFTCITQDTAALPGSLQSNITFALRMNGLKDTGELNAVFNAAAKKVERADWIERAEQPAACLSSDECYLLYLARALALAPKVLLLLEPPKHVFPLLRKLSKTQHMLVFTQSSQVALKLSKHALNLSEGGALLGVGLSDRVLLR